jgi:hypothetical protein
MIQGDAVDLMPEYCTRWGFVLGRRRCDREIRATNSRRHDTNEGFARLGSYRALLDLESGVPEMNGGAHCSVDGYRHSSSSHELRRR